MKAFERALEWLRPLVETKAWDYCVVWKLGDDPSRFIEWVGCCCAGSYGDHVHVKVESDGERHSLTFCKDQYAQHPIRTKACEALAHLPSSMPLYSGIHGEVVLSAQPRWLGHGKPSNSNNPQESNGTQVLIPVVDGLIELFSVKDIAEDQNVIEFIKAQEVAIGQNNAAVIINEQPLNTLLDKCPNNSPAAFHCVKLLPRLQFLPTITQPIIFPGLEGSPTGSSPSHEQPSLSSGSDHVVPKVLSHESNGVHPGSRKPNCDEDLSKKHEIHFILGSASHANRKHNLKARQKAEREQYHSKNLVTERNRRNRIKDGLFSLRALVPKISKMDRASILGDAIEYIDELQKKVKKFQDELREMAEEDCNKNNAKQEIPDLHGVHESNRSLHATEHKQDPSHAVEKKPIEAQVEVKQIGTKEFLLKLFCKQTRGGFAKLMEAMDSLGFQVLDANVTTINGRVLNILEVEANKTEVQPQSLRDALIKLTSQTCHTVDGKSMKRRS